MDKKLNITTSNDQASFEKLGILIILGVSADDPDKEEFLRQLQEAIWAEIFSNEIEGKLETAEIKKLEAILQANDASDDEKRDKLYAFLATKLPNYESLIRHYTLSAKQDLLVERLEGLKEYYETTSPNEEKKLQVERAGQLFDDGQLVECVNLLNNL